MTGTVDDSVPLSAAVDAAIEACGGDAREAVRALIVANNYLEAEVKRLAKAVSAGFARGQRTKREGQSAFPRPSEERANFWHDIEDRFPHFVDLVLPEDGFPEVVEGQIASFLEPLSGRYDLIVDLRHDHLIMRYCFARKEDADAFRAGFLGAAVNAGLKNTG